MSERRAPFDLDRALAGRHLPALDGLRAVSVLVVIASHSPLGHVPGDLGVSAFFVLSGFLITWLLGREHVATGHVSLRRFYARRALRIFPAYYLLLLVSAAADHALGEVWSPGLWLAGLFYGMNYYNAVLGHPDTVLAHCWSLAVEEQFYLLWPALFLLAAPRGRRARATLLVVAIAVVALWRSVLWAGFDVGTAWVYNAFDTRFDNLAVGCLLATALETPRARAIARRIARRAWMPLLPLAALLVSREGIGETWHYTAGLTLDAVLLAVLLVQVVQLSALRAWAWLDHPVVRYVGRISYPMYLWHGWGMAIARRVPLVPPLARFGLGVLATIALASLSYRLVERPFLRWKERFAVENGGAADAPARSAAAGEAVS